jgi:hypothetical protein
MQLGLSTHEQDESDLSLVPGFAGPSCSSPSSNADGPAATSLLTWAVGQHPELDGLPSPLTGIEFGISPFSEAKADITFTSEAAAVQVPRLASTGETTGETKQRDSGGDSRKRKFDLLYDGDEEAESKSVKKPAAKRARPAPKPKRRRQSST